MARYDQLNAFFRRQKASSITLSFTDVGRLVGRHLPRAAWDETWWSEVDAPQVLSWWTAGFSATVDVARERVEFSRGRLWEEPRRFDA